MKHSRFLISGVRAIEEALTAEIDLESIIVAREALTEYGRDFLSQLTGRGIEIIDASPSEVDRIDDSRTSQGIVAIASLDAFPMLNGVPKGHRVLILDRISDPSNLGAILRSAFAFGFEEIVLRDGTTDPLTPKVIRSSAGNLFHLRLYRGADLVEQLSLLKQSGYRIVGTDSDGDPSANTGQINKLALVVGNEAHGISDEIIPLCDKLLRIPINEACESLSAPIAASIAMYLHSTIDK